MNNVTAFILGGAAGASIGFFACRGYFDKKYREIADAEIESVMVKFGRKKKIEKAQESATDIGKPHILRESIDPESKKANRELVKKLGYANQEEQETAPSDMDPYVIDPDDFDTKEDYDTMNLTYFADGVLVDDNDHQLGEDEIEAAIGSESLYHFGEYEDDSVHVRNDRLKLDYEILKDERAYSEAMRFRPHMEEDD